MTDDKAKARGMGRKKVYTKDDLANMDKIIKEELAAAPYRDTIALQSMEIQKLRAENAALLEKVKYFESLATKEYQSGDACHLELICAIKSGDIRALSERLKEAEGVIHALDEWNTAWATQDGPDSDSLRGRTRMKMLRLLNEYLYSKTPKNGDNT